MTIASTEGDTAVAGVETTGPPNDAKSQAQSRWLSWVSDHRKSTGAIALVVTLGLIAVVDWPHRATASELRSDFAQYATQVRGDLQSCSVEVEESLSAYNQVTAGVVSDRGTASAIASQTALDCTPMGNSRIDDLGTMQPPASLRAYNLDAPTQKLYTWCFPAGVDLAQDMERLMSSPGDPTALADVKRLLTQMNTEALSAQRVFDSTAAALGMQPVEFDLSQVQPGILVG